MTNGVSTQQGDRLACPFPDYASTEDVAAFRRLVSEEAALVRSRKARMAARGETHDPRWRTVGMTDDGKPMGDPALWAAAALAVVGDSLDLFRGVRALRSAADDDQMDVMSAWDLASAWAWAYHPDEAERFEEVWLMPNSPDSRRVTLGTVLYMAEESGFVLGRSPGAMATIAAAAA